MSSLATPLALVEFFGTLAILVLLVVSFVWKRHLIMRALVAAIVFGIVFANPFGVVAEPSAANARSLTPTSEADGARHWVEVAGIPVAWFTPYDDPYPWAGLYENTPNSDLKLRYGFSFLPTTGASSVVAQCDNSINTSCWRDRPDDYPLVHRDADDRAFVVPLTQTLVPNAQGEFAYPSVQHVYDVRLGFTSWRGAVYWLVVVAALVLAASMSRLRLRSLGIAVAASVAIALVGAGALAAVPAPERSAASVTPELLPEPAEAPPASGTVQTTSIESVDPACLARNSCDRIDRLTAVETADGMLAIWTAESDGLMELRTRPLSSRGEPLAAGSKTVRFWRQTSSPGELNCEVPAELQAARLADGEVLVAWSSACDLVGGGVGPASIRGAVLSPSGDLVREPFLVLGYDRGETAATRPRYWLRATTAGEALLIWEAPTRTAYYGRALYASRLNADLLPADPTEFLYDESGFASVAVACGDACVVAEGRAEAITVHVLDSSGRVLRREGVARGPAMPRSELVAAARGSRYHTGWLESDGVNVDGYLATLGAGKRPAVQRVASRIPAGDGARGHAQDPLGIVLGPADAALVFQTPTARDDELLLHVASREDVSTRSTGVRLGDPAVVGRVLVAIGGRSLTTPAEPVSVRLR